MIRVFRARSSESVNDARLGRAELVTLGTNDLVRIVSRCQTPFSTTEIDALKSAATKIPAGAAADIVLASRGRVVVELRQRPVA